MFVFQLCEHLGYPHPDYLLRLLTARQLLDWIEYGRRVGRFGVDRDDLLWGLLTWTVGNAWGGGNGKIEDCMPYYEAEEEDLTPEQLEAKLAALLPRGGRRRKRVKRWVDPEAVEVINLE